MIRKAYSLVEAVVAVSVLTVIISVGVSIIFVSSDTESTNKDLLIGNSLAAEGAEAMKSIYYTNILKYGEDDIDKCGLMRPEFTNDASLCDDNANYLYEKDGNDRYYMLTRKYQTSGGSNDLLTWELVLDSGRHVSIADDGSLEADTSYRLNIRPLCKTGSCTGNDVIGEIYAHDGTEPTKFYREILTKDKGDSVLISSRVHWVTSEGNIRTVENNFELPTND